MFLFDLHQTPTALYHHIMTFGPPLEPLARPMKKPIDAEIRIVVSQRIAFQSLEELDRLDWSLIEITAQIRGSKEAIRSSRKLLQQLRTPPTST